MDSFCSTVPLRVSLGGAGQEFSEYSVVIHVSPALGPIIGVMTSLRGKTLGIIMLATRPSDYAQYLTVVELWIGNSLHCLIKEH